MKDFLIYLKENTDNKITLYHGTTPTYADMLLKSGWKPNAVSSGANMGNPKYLYLTSGVEDAEWYSEQKGENTVLEIKDIPISYLRPDPEDEAGYEIEELLNSLKNNSSLPRKFILIKSLPAENFKKIK